MSRVGLALALSLGVAACGGDEAAEPALAGSVSRVYPLDFSTVRARQSAGELAIQYVAQGGAVPVQVVVRRADCPVEGPGRVDLAACGAVLGSRGATDLPPFQRGELRLTAYGPAAGAPVTGDFDAVLATADGREFTVRGAFDTRLQQVE